MSIYKYFDKEKYARRFVSKGEILLRPLAYYRALEIEEGGRGDHWDGVLRYAPADGLTLNMEDGRTVKLHDYSFNASVRQHEIFVWCASKELSSEIAKTFGAFCVETDPELIINRLKLRAHTSSLLDYSKVVSGGVDYRPMDQLPLADWALPEKVALIKPEGFANQDEFRIAIGRHGALEPENVEVTLSNDEASEAIALNNSKLLIKLGDITEHAIIHQL